MSRQTPQVPPELTDLLLEFTVNVLIERPSDLVEYAANYFNQLLTTRTENAGQQVYITVSDSVDESIDDDIIEDEESIPNITNKYTRRKSVFAEQYNPEEDDEDEAEKIIHPKTDEQRQRLGEAIKDILLFRSLDQQQLQEVLDAMFERKVEEGEIVIRQDDDGDNFYVIDRGIFNIYVRNDKGVNTLVGKYDNSGSFGELALMYNMPRAATIEAASSGALWAMNRQTFRRIVLKSAFRKRKIYEQLLEKVPMLKTLESYERMNLCDALMPKEFQDGELIIKQGDEADGMYFVEEGVVRVTIIKTDNTEVEISQLKKGGYFGELALVTQKPRAASIYAVGKVKLALLDVHAFERLLGPCMDIMRRNVDHYKKQIKEIFGSEANISDVR